MAEQKFMICKSSFPLREEMFYIIVACGSYNRKIYAEGHVLIVRPGHESILFHFEPAYFPQDENIELSGILQAHFESGKDQLNRWSSTHAADSAFSDVRELAWEQVTDSKDLAVLLMSDKRIVEKFHDILKANNCTELEKFVSQARDLQELQLLYEAC